MKDMSLKQQNNDTNKTPRELNEVEILELWTKNNKLNGAQGIIDFARAILKASKK
jgi:hypothetical protein